MITIKNVQTVDGLAAVTHTIPSQHDEIIDATGLTLLPALIDPHVHFRVPGAEHKEDWQSGARAAIAGGVTTVFDMPNNTPACTTHDLILQKKKQIDHMLNAVGIPLQYYLYIGATQENIPAIEDATGDYIAIKVFLGQSTGNLLMDDDHAFREVCRIASEQRAIVAIHAEDEQIMKANKEKMHPGPADVALHSKIRSREAAVVALEKALNAAKRYGTTLYILHTSTQEEMDLIRAAKKEGLPVFAETTPHHLFLSDTDYSTLGTRGQMNPPLRTKTDQDALWQGIRTGTIDTIGTDHAPHTLAEKNLPYGEAPSGVPGIETLLPLLLTAHQEGQLSLTDIIRVTRTNAETIFRLPINDDVVLVDLNKKKIVRDQDLKTKCGWSPFAGKMLSGWPVYTICQGNVFRVDEI